MEWTTFILPQAQIAHHSGESAIRAIAFVEASARMGGVQHSTLSLAAHLDRTRWEPIVISPEEGDLTRACREKGIPMLVVRLPKFYSTSFLIGATRRLPNPAAWVWNLFSVLSAAWRIKEIFSKLHPNLIITKGLFSHLYGGLAARWVGIPCIWHVQDLVSERFGAVYQKFFSSMANLFPKYIIVDGCQIARQMPASVRDRVSVLYNAVDTEVFHPGIDNSLVRRELHIPPDAIVIGNVARLTPWKGQHILLEAFARIADQLPNLYLLLVGSSLFCSGRYERQLHSRASQLGLNGRIIFSGYREDLPQVLAAMNIFVYTSLEKDTSPLSMLSAMAMGLPIVASNIKGLTELLTNNREGLLVPVGDVCALAATMKDALCDEKLRQRLGQAARTRCENDFSLDRYILDIERVLELCLATECRI